MDAVTRPIAIIIIESGSKRDVHEAAESAALAARYYRRGATMHTLDPRKRRRRVSVLNHDRSGYVPGEAVARLLGVK